MPGSYPFTRTNRICVLLVAAIIFSTKLKWCQVQGKVEASYPGAYLHDFSGTSSSAISRSPSMRESNDELNKTPISMQSSSRNDSIRRLMWPRNEKNCCQVEKKDENGETTRGRRKRIVIPSSRHRIQSDHASPTSSASVKYVIRKPIEHNLVKKMSMKRFIPTAWQMWNGANAPKVLGFKRQPENYRKLEELAVREWEKQQKNITEKEATTPEPIEELLDNSSSEEWIPVLIKHSKSFGKDTNSSFHSAKQQLSPEAFRNIEIVAEASAQHDSRYRTASEDGFRNSTTLEDYHSRHESNTSEISVRPVIGKIKNKSTLALNPKLKKSQTIPTETATTERSKKQPATTFRGTLKFGDKLY